MYDDLTAWQNMMFPLNFIMWDGKSEKKRQMNCSRSSSYMNGAMTKRTVFQKE
ncbi:MAG: hypothetical protein ACYDEF_05990 [Methanosarcina sp.]